MMLGLIDLMSLLFVTSLTGAVLLSSGLTHARSALSEALPEIGITGMYLGLVMMLQNMDDPEAIFPALGVACLPVLYVSIIGFVVQNQGSAPESDQLVTVAKLRYPSLILVAVTLYFCGRGDLSWFLDPNAVILTVLLFAVGITLQRRQGELDAVKARAFFPTIGLIIGAMGVLLALSNLSNPKAIGPAMAMGFLAVVYTSIIKLVWIIIQPGASADQNSAASFNCAPWRTLMAVFSICLIILSFATV